MYCSTCSNIEVLFRVRARLQTRRKSSKIDGALQAAEKLGREADSVSSEGGGGFNPRIKPAKHAGFSPGETLFAHLTCNAEFFRSLFSPRRGYLSSCRLLDPFTGQCLDRFVSCLHAPKSAERMFIGVSPRRRSARRLSESCRFASRRPLWSTTSLQWNQAGGSNPSAR